MNKEEILEKIAYKNSYRLSKDNIVVGPWVIDPEKLAEFLSSLTSLKV